MLIAEIRELMLVAMARRGIKDDDAAFMADDYLDAELEGRQTHGIGKFLLIDAALEAREGSLEITAQHGSVVHIDGRKSLGQLAAREASIRAASLAKVNGIGLVTLRNASRYSRLSPYAQTIATEQLVAIVTNNAGPAAVAPFGASRPLFGTNPIAFGFPRGPHAEPYIIDISTAERVWGEIRQAMLEGRSLPEKAFLDIDGYETTNPRQVESVLPFGGHKGSALCLAIELLAGLVAGGRVGLQVDDEYGLGAVFIAIAPELRPNGSTDPTGGLVDLLLEDLRGLPPVPGGSDVRAPGDRSAANKKAALDSGRLMLDDETLELLQRMAGGGEGLHADKLTN